MKSLWDRAVREHAPNKFVTSKLVEVVWNTMLVSDSIPFQTAVGRQP